MKITPKGSRGTQEQVIPKIKYGRISTVPADGSTEVTSNGTKDRTTVTISLLSTAFGMIPF